MLFYGCYNRGVKVTVSNDFVHNDATLLGENKPPRFICELPQCSNDYRPPSAPLPLEVGPLNRAPDR